MAAEKQRCGEGCRSILELGTSPGWLWGHKHGCRTSPDPGVAAGDRLLTGHEGSSASPPTAPQPSSWQEDTSSANTQLRHSLHLEQQLSGVRG